MKNTSVFSFSAFIAYVVGIIAGHEAIAKMFLEPLVYAQNNIPQSSKDGLWFLFLDYLSTNLVYVNIACLTVIGVKFYWYASYVNNNIDFFKLLEANKKNLGAEAFVRFLWVFPSMVLPIFLLSDLFIIKDDKLTFVLPLLILMFLLNAWWTFHYLTHLRGITKGLVKWHYFILLGSDFIIAAVWFFLTIFTKPALRIYEGDPKVFFMVFMIGLFFTSIVIFLQLAMFIPGVLNRKYQKLTA